MTPDPIKRIWVLGTATPQREEVAGLRLAYSVRWIQMGSSTVAAVVVDACQNVVAEGGRVGYGSVKETFHDARLNDHQNERNEQCKTRENLGDG